MEAGENQRDRQLGEHPSKLRRRAINQLAIGSIILLWGSLLTLKQVGIMEKNVSTWPFVLAAFGILLVAGSIHRLSISKRP
jgi:hypothetical protein